MNNFWILLILAGYFTTLMIISRIVGRKGSGNDAFFRANRQSKWWVVAIGMIGTSISGVTFVSVPGMVREIGFNYMQMVLGFFFGYIVIAKVLLPMYYKLNLTTIYTYLENRFGVKSYKTGASFFLLGKTIGAAARLYIAALILQQILFNELGIPFWLTVCCTMLIIWLYTQRSGTKTVIWTDIFQTIVMLVALVMIVVFVVRRIDFSFHELWGCLKESPTTRIFVWDDWQSKQYFWKQFLSGVFIPIVMTGLDQDMMQKNLTCRTLKDAQRNMYWYGASFLPINFLFLTLGALLLLLAQQEGIVLPQSSDEIMTLFASQYLGPIVFIFFVVGIISAVFSSADSALTALTTSFTIDLLGVDKFIDENKAVRYRKWTHFGISIAFVFIILFFSEMNDRSLIDAIYTIVSYTYGPLLGLYAMGLFTRIQVRDKFTPYIAVISPFLCYFLSIMAKRYIGYTFGYELLMLNGFITFVGLYVFRKRSKYTRESL